MTKDEIKRERLRILREETSLNARSEAGEDVSSQLLACGKELLKLSKQTPRKDVMDVTKRRGPREPVASEALIKQAAQNGITKIALENRIRYGWKEETAATQPMRNRGNPELIKLAAKSGINRHTLYSRLQKGWSDMDAATKPLVRTQYEELTLSVEEYNRMKDAGLTDRQIATELETTMHRMYKFKAEHGLNRKYGVML